MSEQTAVPMTITSYDIRNKIYTIRGLQVMLDADLAELYHVNTKALNQAVKRNINRFPSSFCFQLTLAEKEELVTTCDRLTRLKHSSVCPNVFTESGVAMLSAILRSDVAVNTSIAIMNAFISLSIFFIQRACASSACDNNTYDNQNQSRNQQHNSQHARNLMDDPVCKDLTGTENNSQNNPDVHSFPSLRIKRILKAWILCKAPVV